VPGFPARTRRCRPAGLGPASAARSDLAGASPEDEGIELVLDHYHVIASAQVYDSVEFLVEHLPAGLWLMLASRTDPPLALARLRARGLLAELRAAQSRFTAAVPAPSTFQWTAVRSAHEPP
jgi:LuxR family maltose regulon positive regulatory protein